MLGRRSRTAVVGLCLFVVGLTAGSAEAQKRPPTHATPAAAAATPAHAWASSVARAPLATALTDCSSGAHSLSKFGDRVYPEMGNGGYTSLHTDVYLNYDAIANLFLPGTRADLQVRSTQCLSDLSFDFEQTNGHTADGSGPNMTVNSVEINGQPASVHVRAADVPGRPERPGRPRPDRARRLEREPGQRDEPEPARLLAAGQQQRRRTGRSARRTSSWSRRRRRSRTGRPSR